MMKALRARLQDEGGFSLTELLVVVVLLGLVGVATTNVVLTSRRAQQLTLHQREVLDDARVSVDRLHKELRQAKLVYAQFTCGPTSAATCTQSSKLHFWVDHNQDNLQQVEEQIFYCVRQLGGSTCVEPDGSLTGFALVRYTQDDVVTGAAPTILAVTLVNDAATNPPFSFNVAPRDTRLVTVNLDFSTGSSRGLDDGLPVTMTIRLRNVA